MNWAVAGLVYAAVYAGLVSALSDREWARLVVGNIGLLLPPLALLAALLQRRSAWRGRQAVFFAALGAWAALWLVGQIGWAYDELFAATSLPWFKWHIILQLCGSALPLIALVAWPHRDNVTETSITVALDITVLVFLTGFLYWSLIIAPGTAPEQSPLALRMLAIVGPLVRLSAGVGRGDRAAVADAAAHRGAVVDTAFIARAAVRRAADGDRRRLLEPLPDAARPAGRRLARAGDGVHLDLRRRDRDGAAAGGAARRGAGEPACAPAGDGMRTGGRAHRDHWCGRSHRVRERRVLPRVRLLARGARLAAPQPA